jgi:hypothetical protein
MAIRGIYNFYIDTGGNNMANNAMTITYIVNVVCLLAVDLLLPRPYLIFKGTAGQHWHKLHQCSIGKIEGGG